VLLLDEPTNDLDIPTLEVLEESLNDFPGALVLVTHDRYLLDRVSNAVLGLDGRGNAQLYADYWQWEQARQAASAEQSRSQQKPRPEPAAQPAAKKKLSYLEAREWEQMEEKILQAESALEAVRAAMQSPEVVSDGQKLQATYEKLKTAEAAVDALYARWAELESRK